MTTTITTSHEYTYREQLAVVWCAAVIIWTTDHKEAPSLPWPQIISLNNVSSNIMTKICNKESYSGQELSCSLRTKLTVIHMKTALKQ